MEWKKSIQVLGVVLCFVVLITEITAAPAASSAFAPEDYEQYEQGMRELMEELERQGGLTAPMVPRSYYVPNHRMTRKSQRSNTLRLRFGKRSLEEVGSIPAAGIRSALSQNSPVWKVGN